MILLDSLYINNGGGKVLLDYLVRKLHESDQDVYYLFDERCRESYQYIDESRKVYLEPRILIRHKFYKKNINRFSKVLCFGNIPPTIKLKVPVYTYFHNLILIRRPPEIRLKVKFLLTLKENFIKFQKNNTDYFIVQSDIVKEELLRFYHLQQDKCKVIPFFEEYTYSNIKKKKNEFLYVSDGNGHKNHLRLLKAWKTVNQSNSGLKLHLTVSKSYPKLQQLIQAHIDSGVNIINHGAISKKELRQLYADSSYLVYPSLIESFGLGLIEGFEAGCEIIAADLPYVHTILKPYKTFDPLSVQSIIDTILSIEQDTDYDHQITQLKIKNEINSLINILTT